MIEPQQGTVRITAVSAEAEGQKITAGFKLADARAAYPGLICIETCRAKDRLALEALVLWCGRYSPWVAIDGDDGLLIDITGCAHLFGGESRLLAELGQRFRQWGIEALIAAADSQAAAWAWARYGDGGVLRSGETEAGLKNLPVMALRIDPEAAASLCRLGLKRVGDLALMPASLLLNRFGEEVIFRLYKMLGQLTEPFVPLDPPAIIQVRMAWPEPIGRHDDIEAATENLLIKLCEILENQQEGARRLRLDLCRIDGAVHKLEILTSRPNRKPLALKKLFVERLDGIDLGFGVECMRLAAVETDPLRPRQIAVKGGIGEGVDGEEALADLIDRLSLRFGPDRVLRLQPIDSHIPERAVRPVPASRGDGSNGWPARGARPLRLLSQPQSLQVMAPLPDDPPLRIGWGGAMTAVHQAEGPERIEPEWWRGDNERRRDYYRLDDARGRRFWIYREGAYGEGQTPEWFLHGRFA